VQPFYFRQSLGVCAVYSIGILLRKWPIVLLTRDALDCSINCSAFNFCRSKKLVPTCLLFVSRRARDDATDILIYTMVLARRLENVRAALNMSRREPLPGAYAIAPQCTKLQSVIIEKTAAFHRECFTT
jgi:hypothetical protein